MEPLDPPRNDESSGFSKRRISSILKAPRKSIIFPDPVKQERVVECAKPVEKRNSRRVSFAPANDVLLFSNDVKNASPARSPLQDLTPFTAADTQNRVQVAVTEDGIQQITGMETLLNAPLHASQQKDTVNFGIGNDFGEKTVMFSTDDAFMDMTQSHTINIANDADILADISLQNFDILPTSRDKTVMFSADDGSMDVTLSHTMNKTSGLVSLPTSRNMDLGAENRNISSSVPCLDAGFENFLASLFKPNGPSVNPAGTTTRETNSSLAQIITQQSDVDKENQAPTSVSAVMERSLNTSRKIGQLSYGSALCPTDDMDLTEAQTGRIQGFADDDSPFQCHLPMQEAYSQPDSRMSQTAVSKQTQSSGLLASFNPNGMTSLMNPSLHASHQRHKVNLETKDDCIEKTIVFTAGNEFMDMTQSHTVNIDSGLLAPPKQNRISGKVDNASTLVGRKHETGLPGSSANGLDQGFKHFLSGLSETSANSSNPVNARMVPPAAAFAKGTVDTNSLLSQPKTEVGKENRSLNTARSFGELFNAGTICPENDVSMDMTEAQTGRIEGFVSSEDLFQSIPTDMYPTAEMTSEPNNSEALGSSKHTGLETLKPSLKTKLQRHQVKFDDEDDYREKTVRFSADDACMDVTQSHTVNIATDLAVHSPKNVDFLPDCGEKTVRFTANDAAMDVTQSHTVNIVTDFDPCSHQNVDLVPAYGEKTVRFTANDAAMDVTQSHTVKIVTGLDPQSHQNVDLVPVYGEKTVRFTANDAAMDVTQSHTVNIVTDFNPQSHTNLNPVPACGEKTVRFTANDAAMDVTRSHTVNIATDFDPQLHPNRSTLPACEEKTVRFTANDGSMDVTRSHTVTIATDFNQQSHKNEDFIPTCGEKTVRFTANDAAMDVTQSHTVNIASNSVSDSVLPHRDSNILSANENVDFSLSVKKRESETCRPRRNRSSSAQTLDPGFKNSLSRMSGPWANPLITKAVAPDALTPPETEDANGVLDRLKKQKSDFHTENDAPGSISAVLESPKDKTMTGDNLSMAMTEAHTGHVIGQTCTDESPQCLSSTQDLSVNSDHLNKTEMTAPQSNGALGSSSPEGVEITTHSDSLDLNETDNGKKAEPTDQTCSPSAIHRDDDSDTVPSQKSRRKSFADLHSKIRRLSHMINTVPDTIAMESCTASLPQLEHNQDKTQSLPVMEPELEMGSVDTEEDAQCLMEEKQPSTTYTTPFNLKTKQLMSRLSVGGFKPKLPQRSKPDEPNKVNSVGELTRTVTVNVTNQLNNFDDDVSDIYDEELGSIEDMSEILDTRSPRRAQEKVSPSKELYMDGPLEDNVFEEEFMRDVQGQKRPLPVDENDMEAEKRMRGSSETATYELETQSHPVECDSNITTASCTNTQTTDESNSSHTATIKCEATFESTFRQSLFESQLEDYASDMQRKVDDGTITVLEFFKLFNIDFVIHNPRQSVLPGRLLSDCDRTSMDLLKERHINRPKQVVYQTDVLNLTEKVEGLKERMRDLDRPLKIVNGPLWEEIRKSSEKELKSFGAKLKERNNLFRKTSKVESHEMKEVLYSNLVQANLEEQQRLRGTIEEADEMIKSLDDCIKELETEVAAVEEKGVDNKSSLKSRQEEMQKVTEALVNNEREITELEMLKKQNSNKKNRVKAETMNLERHITALHLVNEWKFAEKKDQCTVYTFLHETFHLQLVFEKSNGNEADNQSERKISHITFKHQLDDEKSQGHACLVHKLLSQYIDGKVDWVEKYPTSRHVPKLLHDVGLVVGRCRLLGEELRLLNMWGGLRLDILGLSCVDTQVHIIFSSLKKLSKFEVIFSVSLTDHLCVLQVQNFKNTIGGTTIQQIEEIVSSFSPGKNQLTKIVKKIHQNLLC